MQGNHLRLMRGGAVADRNDGDGVTCHPRGKRRLRLIDLPLRRVRVDYARIDDSAEAIEHRDLAASSVAGVDGKDPARQ